MQNLRARYVFPVARPPLRDGLVQIHEGRITQVTAWSPGTKCRDLGEVALIPGLVNAHTHLEFSDLEQPLGHPGMSFPDWIREVIRWRRNRTATTPITTGLAESRRHGVTLCGDIVTGEFDAAEYRDEVSVVGFRELLGLADSEIERLVGEAQAYLDRPPRPGWTSGLSPHAPYTISLACLARLTDLSTRRGVPLAMHLAESPAELQLLHSGTGTLVDLLDELAAWHPTVVPPQTCPLDYLELLAGAHRALVIHGNYLRASEIDFLSQQRDRLSVVYCPRTHSFFQHSHYPLPEMLDANVRVAIGTDSRASNPNLSLPEELVHLVATHPGIRPAIALRLATLDGAESLGQARHYGSIEAGKVADLVAITLPRATAGDPHEDLLHSPWHVAAVYRAGRQVA